MISRICAALGGAVLFAAAAAADEPRHCANPPEYPSSGPLHAKLHINQLKGAWGFSGVGEAGKDANGYPVALGDAPVQSRILRADPAMAGIAPYTGRFRLYGRGTGLFHLRGARHPGGGGRMDDIATIRLPRREVGGTEMWHVDFEYIPETENDRVVLALADLPIRGDHIRDLALVHESHVAAFEAGARFMPEVVADFSRLGHEQFAATGRRGALRHMQALHTNQIWTPGETTYLTQSGAQRERRFVGPDFYSFVRMQNNGGSRDEKLIPTALPVEDVVALANATGTDVWYNLAPDILDARAVAIAEYMRDHLAPGLTVYWEYGNEIWNSAPGFQGYAYAAAQGEAAFPGLDGPGAAYEWDVYRGMQLFARIRDVFAAEPARARYVAAFWAIAGSNRPDGRIKSNSYAGRYFAAERARRKPDIGALPEEIITDMAVGGYFGTPSGAFTKHLLEHYDTDAARAAALERYVMLGMDGDLVILGPDALRTPPEGLAPEAPLSVHRLIRPDVAAGLDPFAGLDRVLRLQGSDLEYRGARAAEWTLVARFAAPPEAGSVAGLVAAGQLMGQGRKFYGAPFEGSNFQILNTLAYRVDAHMGLAREYGLDFHFYEGGVSTDGLKGPDPEAARGFMDRYMYGGGAARVMTALMQRAAPDVTQICWYKSHNRYLDDYRGLKRYYGEPAAAAPKWQAVLDSIDRAAGAAQ